MTFYHIKKTSTYLILRKKFVFVNVRETIVAKRCFQAIKKPDQVGVFFVIDSRTWDYALELMALAILPDFIWLSTWEQGQRISFCDPLKQPLT